MRSYKKPLIVILAVFLLPVLLSGALLIFIWLDKDHEQLKTQLQSWFKQQTQHELLIAGPLEINFYPSFHLSAGQVSIRDDAQLKLLELENMLVEVDPFSVFENLLIEKVVIQKARLKLIKTKTGEIVFFQQKPENKTSTAKQTGLFFPFSNVEVMDSEIHLMDHNNRKLAKLLDTNASIVADNRKRLKVSLETDFYALSDKPIDISLKGDINTQAQNEFETGNIRLLSKASNLNSVIKIKKHEQDTRILISIIELNPLLFIEHLGMQSQLNEKSIFKQLNGQVEIYQHKGETDFILEQLTIDDSRLQGKAYVSNEMLKIDLQIDELNIEPYLEFFSDFIKQDKTEESGKEIIASIRINHLKLLHGEIEKFANHLHLKDKAILKTEGSLIIKQTNPRQLYKRYTELLKIPEYSKQIFSENNLNFLDGKLSYQYANNKLALKDMSLKIDDTILNGSISFKMPVDEINADLSIGRLDLDRYDALIPKTDADKASSVNTEVDLESLLQRLEAIAGQGNISIESLNYQGTIYKGIDIQFN